MSKKTLTIAVLSAFILTACGHSHHRDTTGGNGYVVNFTNNSGDTASSNNTPFEMKEQFTSFTIENKDGKQVASSKTSMTAEEQLQLQQIIKSIDPDAAAQNDTDKGFYSAEYQLDEKNIAGKLFLGATNGERGTAYAKYGIDLQVPTIDGENTTKLQLFYTGEETEAMPTTGKVTYLGKAIASTPEAMVNTGELGNYYGDSSFQVDFDSKKLTGTLNNWQVTNTTQPAMQAVNIEADIKANTFQGTANSSGYAEGKFYGPDAANIAGSFDDKDQKLFGVFGANKQ
ncbi:MAG: transferrin-binding protein-like solute binding protein [Cardiobacteriaceae bacterium]|nr:transferrin-binding protein-like solute binding protein [Cardiobacteriaceae bacterium]